MDIIAEIIKGINFGSKTQQTEDTKQSKPVHRLTPEEEQELRKTVKRDKSHRVIVDSSKPYGSIDNPMVVGMPDCSTTLIYDRANGRWILTDGLGNGWIR